MTRSQINRIVAEAVGWKIAVRLIEDPNGSCIRHDAWTNGEVWSAIPNFAGSLDAMHKAEKLLMRDKDNEDDSGLMAQYQEELGAVIGLQIPLCDVAHHVDVFNAFIHATAPQRCEAFIRTLGLWREG